MVPLMSETPDRADRTAGELARRIGVDHHDVLLVLGTGLTDVAEYLGSDCPSTPLDHLPYFPPYSAPGHRAEAWSVPLGERRLLILGGRRHLYEGAELADVVHPVRMGLASGCQTVILTAAVGSLHDGLPGGTLATVADQINLTGRTPIAGPEFVDMVDAFDPELRATALATPEVELHPAGVVYAQVPGPQFESPAEAAMLRTLGADVVGMSMALETIAARQAGAHVLGLAMVTNASAGRDVSPEAIGAVALHSVPSVAGVVRHVVMSMA
jgi:purine-nucleoside phosphorylase